MQTNYTKKAIQTNYINKLYKQTTYKNKLCRQTKQVFLNMRSTNVKGTQACSQYDVYGRVRLRQ